MKSSLVTFAFFLMGCASVPETSMDSSLVTCTAVVGATETVRVENAHGTIEGTLEVPSGCAGMPVVLIISGSGGQDRDGSAAGMYKHLAEGLKANGIASLRFDDVGVGGSATAIPSDPEAIANITYELEIDAARKWMPLVRADQRFGALVAAGHSQGALTATLLGREKGGADAVITLAGAGRTIDVVLREQLASKIPPEALVRLDAALAHLRAGELAGPQEPPLDRILAPQVQRYFISWIKYDPSVELARVTRPALIVQGGTDVQVSREDARRLAAAQPRASLVEIADMCHVLKQAPVADALAQRPQYTDASIPLHEALVPAVVDFVRRLDPSASSAREDRAFAGVDSK
jgi:uncharacterized protein